MAEHRCLCVNRLRDALVRAASALKWICSRWERGVDGPDKEREIEKARASGKAAHNLVDTFVECAETEPVTDKEVRYARALRDIRGQLRSYNGVGISRESCALQIADTALETDLEWECLT